MKTRFHISIVLLSGMLLLGAAGTAFAQGSSPAAGKTGPRLEVDADELDLGAVVRGEDVVARFELRNTGNEDLRILKAKPG